MLGRLRDRSKTPIAEMAALPLTFAALLAAAWLGPNVGLIASLRGEAALRDELKGTHGAGYYEALLDAGKATYGGPVKTATPARPHVQFHESGMADIGPEYMSCKLKPGYHTVWNDETYTINSRGYRSPEIDVPKPRGTYRVVVLGSSNTFGHGVSDGEVYTRPLEAWLQKRVPGAARVEVVNLSVPGQSPVQRLYRLTSGEVDRLEPDWVVCDATAVDIWIEQQRLHEAFKSGAELPFDFLTRAAATAGLTRDESKDAAARKLDAVYPDLVDGAYAGLAAETKRTGVPISVILLPRGDDAVKSPRIFRLLGDAARRHGLEVFDLSDIYDGMPVDEFRVGDWDKHPNANGHRLIFEALARAIEVRGGVPGR